MTPAHQEHDSHYPFDEDIMQRRGHSTVIHEINLEYIPFLPAHMKYPSVGGLTLQIGREHNITIPKPNYHSYRLGSGL